SPRPACGERSKPKASGEGDSPRIESVDAAPRPNPLPARAGRRRRIEGLTMAEFDVDLFVIGGGSGGVRAARIAAGHGAKVMVAEEYRVGGTCVIRGCVPKKLLVYAARFADEFEDAAGYGWTVEEPHFSWPKLIANKDREIARVEFAGIFSGLGAQVTLVYRGENILRGFDDDVRAHLRSEMERRGIEVICGKTVQAITRTQDTFTAILSDGRPVEIDKVMFAIGRW